MKLIDKSALVAEIKIRIETYNKGYANGDDCRADALETFLHDIDTLEAKDPYEQCIQYSTVRDGIEAHAETYSFNIESELFNQLMKEQQALWRKEIEQACISGGEAGVELARDPRYKENHEVKEVDLEKEKDDYWNKLCDSEFGELLERDAKWFDDIAKHFFELGLNFQTKDMQEALRIEYEKGRADVLRCIDPDEMVADFCSQPLSKTRSLASIYRQGITDIIKRINNNEKTSTTGTHSIDGGRV